MRLRMEQWRIRVNDVYPAYIAWQTFEQIQQMLLDNYAAYDRNKSRGVPRDGAALLHGIVYCGECGHKWWFSTKTEPAISATICVNNIMFLSANTFTLIQLMLRL